MTHHGCPTLVWTVFFFCLPLLSMQNRKDVGHKGTSFPLLERLPEEPIAVRSKVGESSPQSPPMQSTSLWACLTHRSSGRSRTGKRSRCRYLRELLPFSAFP